MDIVLPGSFVLGLNILELGNHDNLAMYISFFIFFSFHFIHSLVGFIEHWEILYSQIYLRYAI